MGGDRVHTLDGVQVGGVPPEFALHPYGAFTTFVAVDGKVLGWHQHLARLARGARELWGHDLDRDRIGELVGVHLALLGGPASVRVTVYPEELPVATPVGARGCRVLVSSGPTEFPFAARGDFAVCSVEHQRDLAEVKSTGMLRQIHLRRQAQLAGYDDVLFRQGDRVLEGSTWSVVAWRDGEASTPAGPVLPSTTVGRLAQIAETLGWRFTSRPWDLAALKQADLVLAANVHQPARAISRIDDEVIAVDEDLLAALAAAYSALPRDPVAE